MTTNTKRINTNSAHKGSLLYPDLSYKLQGCFFKVYNTLGFGHKEVVYERALGEELTYPHSLASEVFGYMSFPRRRESRLKLTPLSGVIPDLIWDLYNEHYRLDPCLRRDDYSYYRDKPRGIKPLRLNINFGSSKLQIIRRIWTLTYTPGIRENSL